MLYNIIQLEKLNTNIREVTYGYTFRGMPINEREGAKDGGNVCSYKGPTRSSSTTTIPFESRNGNAYEYLQKRTKNINKIIYNIYLYDPLK